MNDYEICESDKGYMVKRGGFRLGEFADREQAAQFIHAHRTFRKSVSGRFASPAEVLSADALPVEAKA